MVCYNTYMDKEILMQAGLSEIQAKIYLFLIENGQKTASEIAKGVDENRTTVYSALEKLEKSEIISQKDRGKISAYVPNHPSVLESLAEKRLRQMARQARNLESNLPSLINFYNEHQDQPGAMTFYGEEGIKIIYDKILATKETLYFIRSLYPGEYSFKVFKNARVKADIEVEEITPLEFQLSEQEMKQWNKERTATFLPKGEYDSPVGIDIFGDNVAFINYSKGMSTLIESPEIADAMRQFFLFSKKYLRKATDQNELGEKIKSPGNTPEDD